MKRVPKNVILAGLLCSACFVLGGVFLHCASELRTAAQLVSLLGILGVAGETFRWGAQQGYVVARQPLVIQMEHGLRCVTMTAILVLVAGLLSGTILQVVFELFWRR